MMNMTTTTAMAPPDIDLKSPCKLISMVQFPPKKRPARAGRKSVQFEIDREVEEHVDRLAVQRAWFELPAADGPHCRPIETGGERPGDGPGGHRAPLCCWGLHRVR